MAQKFAELKAAFTERFRRNPQGNNSGVGKRARSRSLARHISDSALVDLRDNLDLDLQPTTVSSPALTRSVTTGKDCSSIWDLPVTIPPAVTLVPPTPSVTAGLNAITTMATTASSVSTTVVYSSSTRSSTGQHQPVSHTVGEPNAYDASQSLFSQDRERAGEPIEITETTEAGEAQNRECDNHSKSRSLTSSKRLDLDLGTTNTQEVSDATLRAISDTTCEFCEKFVCTCTEQMDMYDKTDCTFEDTVETIDDGNQSNASIANRSSFCVIDGTDSSGTTSEHKTRRSTRSSSTKRTGLSNLVQRLDRASSTAPVRGSKVTKAKTPKLSKSTKIGTKTSTPKAQRITKKNMGTCNSKEESNAEHESSATELMDTIPARMSIKRKSTTDETDETESAVTAPVTRGLLEPETDPSNPRSAKTPKVVDGGELQKSDVTKQSAESASNAPTTKTTKTTKITAKVTPDDDPSKYTTQDIMEELGAIRRQIAAVDERTKVLPSLHTSVCELEVYCTKSETRLKAVEGNAARCASDVASLKRHYAHQETNVKSLTTVVKDVHQTTKHLLGGFKGCQQSHDKLVDKIGNLEARLRDCEHGAGAWNKEEIQRQVEDELRHRNWAAEADTLTRGEVEQMISSALQHGVASAPPKPFSVENTLVCTNFPVLDGESDETLQEDWAEIFHSVLRVKNIEIVRCRRFHYQNEDRPGVVKIEVRGPEEKTVILETKDRLRGCNTPSISRLYLRGAKTPDELRSDHNMKTLIGEMGLEERVQVNVNGYISTRDQPRGAYTRGRSASRGQGPRGPAGSSRQNMFRRSAADHQEPHRPTIFSQRGSSRGRPPMSRNPRPTGAYHPTESHEAPVRPGRGSYSAAVKGRSHTGRHGSSRYQEYFHHDGSQLEESVHNYEEYDNRPGYYNY